MRHGSNAHQSPSRIESLQTQTDKPLPRNHETHRTVASPHGFTRLSLKGKAKRSRLLPSFPRGIFERKLSATLDCRYNTRLSTGDSRYQSSRITYMPSSGTKLRKYLGAIK